MRKLGDIIYKFLWFIIILYCVWAIVSWADTLIGDGDWMFNLFEPNNWRWIK